MVEGGKVEFEREFGRVGAYLDVAEYLDHHLIIPDIQGHLQYVEIFISIMLILIFILHHF